MGAPRQNAASCSTSRDKPAPGQTVLPYQTQLVFGIGGVSTLCRCQEFNLGGATDSESGRVWPPSTGSACEAIVLEIMRPVGRRVHR